MSNPNKQVILDVAPGNITGQYSQDKAILVGIYPNKDSSYVESIDLVLNPENGEPIAVKFPYTGYNLQLFVGDFTGDNRSEIMVRGGFGGSGGFEIAVIYEYKNNQLVEIFNQEMFLKNNHYTAKFKDNYKASINCCDKKFLINLASKPKEYLDNIYSSDKKLKSDSSPYVDAPFAIFPIKQVFNNYYELLIQQRVVGTSNADTLGVVQTFGNLTNSKFNTVYKALLMPSYKYKQRKVSKVLKTNSSANKSNQYNNIDCNFFKRNELYYAKSFNIEKDNIDFIINSINEARNTLYVDAYFFNLKNFPIHQITNLKFELKDVNGKLIAQKIFTDVDIQNGLKPYEGKRVLLAFSSDEYNLSNTDTSNLIWNYTYNIRC